MKYFSMNRSLCSSLLIACLAAAGADARIIDLRLQPDADAPIVATVNTENSDFAAGQPVLDPEKAEDGWMWTEYASLFEGYVSDAKISKQLEPVEGAFIHLGPGADSPVLATVEPGDTIEILDTGLWWRVRFRKAVPVYYRSADPIELPPVVGESESAPATQPATTPQVVELEDEPMPAELEDAPLVGLMPAPPAGERGKPASDIAQHYDGIFRKTGRRMLFFSSPYHFEIVDGRGDHVAFVDVDKLIIPGNVDQFLDRQVIVYGPRESGDDSKVVVIRAQNIRIKR